MAKTFVMIASSVELTALDAGEIGHGARLLVADHQIHHAVLQRLEAPDGHAELAMPPAEETLYARSDRQQLSSPERLGVLEGVTG